MGPETWTFGGARSVRVHSRLVVNAAEAAIDAAIAGVGLTRVLSYQASQPVAAGTLKIVLKSAEPAPLPVSLIYARENTGKLTRKLRAFLDYAAPRLRDRLTALG